jgi:hypothetical protein
LELKPNHQIKNTTMKYIKLFLIILTASFWSCQDLQQPSLGSYPKDANPPGGPLKFYEAFDGSTSNALMNAVDSIKANFPADNPFTTIDGVNGKAVLGVNKKYIKFGNFNDWAASGSVTISFWSKGPDPTQNNKLGNGPEYILSFPAKSNSDGTDYHWSKAVMFLFLESNNVGCQVKWMVVDKNLKDNWFTWEGNNAITGVLDNQWHHFVVRYDASTSTASLFIDGQKNSNTLTWNVNAAPHGDLNMDTNFISESRVGKGPQDSADDGDWLSSSLKRGLDQLRLYGTALSDAEISALYAGKK